MPKPSDLRIVDPVLTTLAIGYKNAQMVAEKLFPIASVNKEGGKIAKFGKEAFEIYKTERAIRAMSNRMNPAAADTIDFVLTEHDLEYPIDYREASEDMFNSEKRATRAVTDIIKLRLEYMCATLAQTAGNFPTGNKITLSGTDQFTDAGSDPIGVIDDAKEAIRGKIGVEPNTMIIGASTFVTLKEHAAITGKIKYSMKGIATVEILKEIFGVENIEIGKAVRKDGATIYDVWSDNIVLAYVAQSGADEGDPNEPSFGYTLRRKGYPQIDTRDENGGKLRIVRNTDLFVPKIVGSDAGYLISDTNA